MRTSDLIAAAMAHDPAWCLQLYVQGTVSGPAPARLPVGPGRAVTWARAARWVRRTLAPHDRRRPHRLDPVRDRPGRRPGPQGPELSEGSPRHASGGAVSTADRNHPAATNQPTTDHGGDPMSKTIDRTDLFGWMCHAACLDQDTELFFDTERAEQAKAVCAQCPVRDDCLGRAPREGVWGGATGPERTREKQAAKRAARNREPEASAPADRTG